MCSKNRCVCHWFDFFYIKNNIFNQYKRFYLWVSVEFIMSQGIYIIWYCSACIYVFDSRRNRSLTDCPTVRWNPFHECKLKYLFFMTNIVWTSKCVSIKNCDIRQFRHMYLVYSHLTFHIHEKINQQNKHIFSFVKHWTVYKNTITLPCLVQGNKCLFVTIS